METQRRYLAKPCRIQYFCTAWYIDISVLFAGWGGKGGRKRLKNSKTLVDGATGKKTHLCETCGRLDENLTTHYNHMREHVNVPCKICGREFHGLSKMKKHKYLWQIIMVVVIIHFS